MTIQDKPAPDAAQFPPDRRPLEAADRMALSLIFGGIAILLLGLALPTLRVLLSDGHWLALTPCTLVTGLGRHLSGGDPGGCGRVFADIPVLGWIGNFHNLNLVAWGFWIFMAGLMSTSGIGASSAEETTA